ncbi:PREDICTED: probable carboxylesterase 9 [Nelumbo nucifera]|uniref:Probable carboxylesterase 9 n=1 Tax=Nelumbo nucifera TaxID=4432 RepID=A0A1U7ZNI9_NELNU|nr:PREDICTED: probable carboxylesterase 9 [Nelumbo nucifera]
MEPIVITKDIIINEEKDISVRMYLPPAITSLTCTGDCHRSLRYPIQIYFHGGLILKESSSVFREEICKKAATWIPTIVLSVNYHLDSEHRLPTAFYEAEEIVMWLKQQALDPQGEVLLREFGDFSRCFFVGWSSGGNIAMYSLLHILGLDIEPLKFRGLILSQPVFGGMERTKSELKYADDMILPLSTTDEYWESILPVGADRDHEFSNPMVRGVYTDKIEMLPKCLVRGFRGDVSSDRQKYLVEILLERGLQVDAQFDDIGFHGIDLVDPRRALITMSKTREFMRSC